MACFPVHNEIYTNKLIKDTPLLIDESKSMINRI